MDTYNINASCNAELASTLLLTYLSLYTTRKLSISEHLSAFCRQVDQLARVHSSPNQMFFPSNKYTLQCKISCTYSLMYAEVYLYTSKTLVYISQYFKGLCLIRLQTISLEETLCNCGMACELRVAYIYNLVARGTKPENEIENIQRVVQK